MRVLVSALFFREGDNMNRFLIILISVISLTLVSCPDTSGQIVIDPPEAPASITVSNLGDTVSLWWSEVLEADYYQIWRKEAAGEWQILSDRVTGSRFTDNDPPSGIELYYGVKSWKGTASPLTVSETSVTLTSVAPVTPDAPASVTAVLNGSQISLSWDASPGAKHYTVYIKYDGSDWTSLADSVISTSWVHNDIPQGTDLLYGVAAGIEHRLSSVTSAATVLNYTPDPLTPSNVQVKEETGSLLITWDEVPGALSYTVYRQKGHGERERIAESLTATSFLHSEILWNQEVVYSVTATDGVNISEFSESSVFLLTKTPEAPVNVTAYFDKNAIQIDWSSVTEAEVYQVFVQYDGGEWQPLGAPLSATSYRDLNPAYDTSVLYSVQAQFRGLLSEKTSIVSPLNLSSLDLEVLNLNAGFLDSVQGIELTWEELKPGVYYHVIRKESLTDPGVELAVINETAFSDLVTGMTPPSAGKIYYYQVLWSFDGQVIHGEGSVPAEGLFYTSVDTREPMDNDRENILVESFILDQPLESLLYKQGEKEDTDWYKHSVPGRSSHFLTGNISGGDALLQVYRGTQLIAEETFPVRDLTLNNTTSDPEEYFIRIIPQAGVSPLNFISDYNLHITSSF